MPWLNEASSSWRIADHALPSLPLVSRQTMKTTTASENRTIGTPPSGSAWGFLRPSPSPVMGTFRMTPSRSASMNPIVAMARKTPRSRNTGSPTRNPTTPASTTPAAMFSGSGVCQCRSISTDVYAPTAMNPGAANDSWPEYRTRNIEVASMLLIPIWAISSVCEFQKPTGSENSAKKKSTGLQPLAQARAEQALRTQHEHQEQGGKRDAASYAAAEGDRGQHLDQAEQVAAEHCAGDAAHAAEDDH